MSKDLPPMADDFLHFVTHANGLYWRFKRGEKAIEFLNLVPIGGLAGKSHIEQLLSNLVFAQSVVVEEDFFRFKLFIKAMREFSEGAVIFRIKDNHERRYWLRMTGAPATSDPAWFYGSLHDITEHVSFINHLLRKDIERQTMIEHDDIPVLLVEMESKTIISRNTLALQLFGFSYPEFDRKGFSEMYPPEDAPHVSKAYEVCLLEGEWEGPLTFIKKNGQTFAAKVKIKRLALPGKNLLRFSFYEAVETSGRANENQDSSVPALAAFAQRLLLVMENKIKMAEILDTLLENQYQASLFDGILYADVHEEKGRIDAYARGGLLNTMKPGISFPFQGSVSQAIRDKQLPFFIMDDTLLSTRPIDWALFIPYGVRSYFAKPFYRGDRLRSLLVFCATQINLFSEKEIPLLELYYPSFLLGLKNYRKDKRGH